MKIYTDLEQGTPEWHQVRQGVVITGSEVGAFVYKQAAKGGFTKTTMDARRKHIHKRLTAPLYDDPDLMGHEFLVELKEKEQRFFDNSAHIQRGNVLEPYARRSYEKLVGITTHEVGFIEADDKSAGVSPDGICGETIEKSEGGLELKSACPEIQSMRLEDGVLPSEYEHQVHTCLAVTGYAWWDFYSYCPGLPPLHVRTTPNDMTKDIADGIKGFAKQYRETAAKMEKIFHESFDGKWKEIEL